MTPIKILKLTGSSSMINERKQFFIMDLSWWQTIYVLCIAGDQLLSPEAQLCKMAAYTGSMWPAMWQVQGNGDCFTEQPGQSTGLGTHVLWQERCREGRALQAEMGVGRASGKNTGFRRNRVQIPPLPPCDFEKAIGSLWASVYLSVKWEYEHYLHRVIVNTKQGGKCWHGRYCITPGSSQETKFLLKMLNKPCMGMTDTGPVVFFHMLTGHSLGTVTSQWQAGAFRQEFTGEQFLGVEVVTTNPHLAIISAHAEAWFLFILTEVSCWLNEPNSQDTEGWVKN